MARVGYYRYKIDNLQPGTYKYTWKVNGEPRCVSTVTVRPKCDESVYVKYLDRYGMYRFIQFNQYWSRQESAQSLGDANSVANYGKVSSMGYDLREIYTLSLEQVTPEELDVYSDILYSPYIYMKIGNETEWRTMTLDSGDNTSRRNRKYTGKFTISLVDRNVSSIIK